MIIIVMGGLGNMTGTVIATFLWAFTVEGMRIWLPMGFEAWRFVLYPLALLLLMLFRPQGIMGRVELGFLRAPKWPRRGSRGEWKPGWREGDLSMTESIQEKPVVLDIKGLCKNFGGRATAEGIEGGLWAVSDFDITVREGELAGLIGPNGAGKTTVFNMISGSDLPTAGANHVRGREPGRAGAPCHHAAGHRPHFSEHPPLPEPDACSTTCALPITPTPATACWERHSAHGGASSAKERELIEQAQDFLAVFNLQDRQDELAKNLPYGEQRRAGDRPRPGHRAQAAAAGRAGRRHEPARSRTA